ncbi:YfiM family protein [Arcobacteraceae bacterium]|nr:YfiM family protein [Arcobacteraceae bacterium]
MKKLLLLVVLQLLILTNLCSDETISQKDLEKSLKEKYSKEDKLVYLNIATSTALIGYGLAYWDYDFLHTQAHTKSEGWFSKDTKSGGADKFGHAYTGYFTSHMFSYTYENWGYSHDEAALNGSLSSLLFTAIMEIGDSFSPYGFSYEDMTANTLGAILGYYTYKDTTLREKLDFRVEYKVRKDSFEEDFMTDYENLKYIFALKASGFSSIKNKYLKYLELYLGYGVEGFADEPYLKRREPFIGIGINLSKLLDTKIFNYYQIPGIYLHKE